MTIKQLLLHILLPISVAYSRIKCLNVYDKIYYESKQGQMSH